MAYNRTLVTRALEKAEHYEQEGNKTKAEYFFKLAEKADKLYNELENKKG